MTSYGIEKWCWAMFKPSPTWPILSFGQLFMWIGANNYQMWLLILTSDSEQCLNRLQRNLISLLVNFSCEFVWQMMTRYDFLWNRKVNLTRYDFLWNRKVMWEMFKPSPTWINFAFGKLFMWIGLNNDQTWLSMG